MYSAPGKFKRFPFCFGGLLNQFMVNTLFPRNFVDYSL